MQDDVIDFEDLFDIDIVTPGGIDSRINELDGAWLTLYESNPDNSYISKEFDLWRLWSEKILNNSWLSKTWATGILNELDKWSVRYSIAYAKAVDTSEAPSPNAWGDEINDHLGKNNLTKSPIFWGAVTIVGGAALALIIHKVFSK